MQHQLCGREDTWILRGRLLLGNLKVAVAARFSPLMHGVAAEVTGYVSRYYNGVLRTSLTSDTCTISVDSLMPEN